MKTLEGLILTFNLDRVKQDLQTLDLGDMKLSEAPSVVWPGVARPEITPTAFLPRVQVRVVVPDHVADAVEAILRDAS
jgi:nitrogen regulatory protein PII